MRVLCIGDLHGCSAALDTLLAAINIQPEDTVVTLGDYVDRGPDSRGVLDRLVALSQNHHSVALRGNHEQMMFKARDDADSLRDWMESGGDATLASYGSLAAVPDAHWRFLENQCLDYWECETHFFVHGGVYADIPLWEQPTYKLYWGKFEQVQPHVSGKIMVCGHTSQKNGVPSDLGYAICLDTWVYGSGWLTCLDVGSGAIWQANQSGQLRHFLLKELPDSTSD